MAATPFITIKDLCMDFPESGVTTDENQKMIRGGYDKDDKWVI